MQQAHIKIIDYLAERDLNNVLVRGGIYAESWWLIAGFQPQMFEQGDTV